MADVLMMQEADVSIEIIQRNKIGSNDEGNAINNNNDNDINALVGYDNSCNSGDLQVADVDQVKNLILK
jgi:hypothetical protein